MRKGSAAIVLAMCALAASSAGAMASNGAATPFKIAYENPDGTSWDCSGARVVNPVSVKDSETCLVTGDTSELTAGVYTGDPYGDLPWFGNAQWASDFGDGKIAEHWTVTVMDNGDGSSTVYAVAYY